MENWDKQTWRPSEIDVLYRLTGGTVAEVAAVSSLPRKFWQYCIIPADPDEAPREIEKMKKKEKEEEEKANVAVDPAVKQKEAEQERSKSRTKYKELAKSVPPRK